MTSMRTPRMIATEAVLNSRVMAILRTLDHTSTPAIAKALSAGGITAIEVTVQSETAFDAIRTIRDAEPASVQVGAGTILTEEQGRRAIAAGASFLVSPHLDLNLWAQFDNDEILYVPGVSTPTEIHAAARSGCDLVKLFPAGAFGIEYLKALRGPFPAMRFLATGGISVDNADQWLSEGASAVGIGGNLAPKGNPSDEELRVLTNRASRLMNQLNSRS